uniref:Uncharacterized protein n=1 Tax=Arundo donax TaxID=35708 RepID=A0A0A8ZMS6_ARUDO
MRRGLFLDQV